jgi:hypothetical protein
MEDGNTLRSMHALVADHMKPQVVELREGTVIVAPKGHEVHDAREVLDSHLANPRRAQGFSRHHTLDSLIAHALRHRRSGATVAFCGLVEAQPRLVVVYDYNPADGAHGGWRQHGALYEFPFSEPWKRWTAAAGGPLSPQQFAELLESAIGDVRTAETTSPRVPGLQYATPAQLLTLAAGLSIRVEQQVAEHRRLETGESQLVFSEAHDTRDRVGEPVKVPSGFLLGIPVFAEGAHYGIPVRLRYRVQHKQLTWHLQLHDAESAKRDAIKEAATRLHKETEVPLFFGSPEQ